MFTNRGVLFIKSLFILMFALIVIHASPVLAEGEYGQKDLPVNDSILMDEQENENSTDSGTTFMESSSVKLFTLLIKTGASLILIGILIYGLVRVLARARMQPKGGLFQVYGGVSLGPNKSLQLVRMGDSLYLLGVGDNIQLIRRIEPGPEAENLLLQVEEMVSSDLRANLWTQVGKFLPEKWSNRMKTEQAADMDNSFHVLLKEKLGEMQNKSRESKQMIWNSRDGEERDKK